MGSIKLISAKSPWPQSEKNSSVRPNNYNSISSLGYFGVSGFGWRDNTFKKP